MGQQPEHDVLIVGAGLSGLCVAHFLAKLNPGLGLVVLEKDARPGGAIQTFREDGFTAEWGAHGFLDSVAESREILEDLNLEREIERAPLKRFVRYVCLNGQLVVIAQSPGKILTGKFMPFRGKLRVLADLWKKPKPEEQSVAQWSEYRFGKDVLPLVDAAVTGTYAGDMERLSIDAAMPGVRQMELEVGSVIRGAIKMRKQKKKADKTKQSMPSMISFKQGMETLVRSLAENITHPIMLSTPATGIARRDFGWEVETKDGTIRARQVVAALDVNSALTLLSSLSRPPAKSVPQAGLINVVMGFGPRAEVPFGFGYLAPRREKRFVLGTLFASHMFPSRAPHEMLLLEALVGGRLSPEKQDLSDQQLVERAYEDLRQILHLPEPPCFARVLRPRFPIPQLEFGHLELQDWRNQLEENCPGIYVCGFGWEGIGINDMTKKAKEIAAAVNAGRTPKPGRTTPKPVYF